MNDDLRCGFTLAYFLITFLFYVGLPFPNTVSSRSESIPDSIVAYERMRERPGSEDTSRHTVISGDEFVNTESLKAEELEIRFAERASAEKTGCPEKRRSRRSPGDF